MKKRLDGIDNRELSLIEKEKELDRTIFLQKLLLFVTGIVLSISVGVMIFLMVEIEDMHRIGRIRTENRGTYQNITDMMEEIKNIYDSEYIYDYNDNVTAPDLEDAALAGFARGFEDEYGNYYSPSEKDENNNDSNEEKVGTGVEISYDSEIGYYLVHVYEGSPADKAGIEAGGYIIGVNDVSMDDEDISASKFLDAMDGGVGTQLNIKVLTSGGEIKHYTLERDKFDMPSVRHKVLDEDIAYIRIKEFTNKTDEEFISAMQHYKGLGFEKFIFDLRDNYGGSAESVIAILDELLPEGLITEFNGRHEETSGRYESDANEITGKFVILTNERSASASELFTQALRDYDKAKVVGKKTYGKGTVLTTYSLSNGGSIAVSTGEYKTKSGYIIEDNGIKPDYEVELEMGEHRIRWTIPDEEDNQLQKAIEVVNN